MNKNVDFSRKFPNFFLCQAVDCLSIYDHICKCAIIVDGKERIEEVRFCREHFLMQKAVDYHKEESK